MPTPFGPWKAALGSPLMRGGAEIAGVPSPGHAYQGTSREPRRAPYLSRSMGVVTPNPNGTRSLGNEGHPQGKRSKTLTRRNLSPRETRGGS
jgi:hypothetical protein